MVLHFLWDWTASAVPITIVLPGALLHWRFLDLVVPAIGLPVPGLIVGAIGIWILVRMFRESVEQPAKTTATGRRAGWPCPSREWLEPISPLRIGMPPGDIVADITCQMP